MYDIFLQCFLGFMLIFLGVMNIRGNISSIHWYNRRKVSQEDAPAYGKCVGIGTAIIGGAILLTVLLNACFRTESFALLTLAGCFVGLAIILYGQFKYNKGIF